MTQNETSRIRPRAKFFFDGDKKFFVKGVTYGPFKPDADGNYVGRPEQVDADLALMRDAGLNVVRIYHSPPRWFLDRCAAAGMRVLVTLPWEKHIEFLRERSTRKQIAENVRASVKTHAGHPAIFGYLVGNEISSTMARWLGTGRVIEFVEELIRIGRAIDPDLFICDVSAHRVSAPAEFRFFMLQRLSSQPARFRRLPAALTKPHRRASAHPR